MRILTLADVAASALAFAEGARARETKTLFGTRKHH